MPEEADIWDSEQGGHRGHDVYPAICEYVKKCSQGIRICKAGLTATQCEHGKPSLDLGHFQQNHPQFYRILLHNQDLTVFWCGFGHVNEFSFHVVLPFLSPFSLVFAFLSCQIQEMYLETCPFGEHRLKDNSGQKGFVWERSIVCSFC